MGHLTKTAARIAYSGSSFCFCWGIPPAVPGEAASVSVTQNVNVLQKILELRKKYRCIEEISDKSEKDAATGRKKKFEKDSPMQMADRTCTLRCRWQNRALPAYEIPPATPGDRCCGDGAKNGAITCLSPIIISTLVKLTDTTFYMTTTSQVDALFPSVAEIVVFPEPIAVITPFDDTVATASSEEFQFNSGAICAD